MGGNTTNITYKVTSTLQEIEVTGPMITKESVFAKTQVDEYFQMGIFKGRGERD